jgi:hypothetical protein
VGSAAAVAIRVFNSDVDDTLVSNNAPDILRSPEPRTLWELIVLILVPETKAFCLAVNADSRSA